MLRQTVTSGRKAAELLAVEALSYIGEEPQNLSRFLALTGLAPETLRFAARESRFLAAVLDYVVGDEALMLAFAATSGRAPAEIVRARETLNGPAWEREAA